MLQRKHILTLSLLIAAIALHGLDAQAATYYVRTDGNDSNSGSGPAAAAAWATVDYASKNATSPGDIVYVKAGTYAEQIYPTVDGTAGSPIRFIADRFGTVASWDAGNIVIQAPAGVRSLYVNNADYLEFHGFHFAGSTTQAVLLYPSAGIILQDCDVTSGHTGVYCYNSNATIINLYCHDSLSYGLYVYGNSIVDAWNCTVVRNGSYGVFTNNTAVLTLTNSIVANNGAQGLRHASSGTFNHTYNLVFGNGNSDYLGTSAGTGEINSEPYFVTSNDYRLQAISPAIDSGTNAAGLVDTDLDGVARPFNSSWDMGCSEYNGGNTYYVRPDGDDANDGEGSTASGAWATVAYAATQSLSPGDVVYVHSGTYTGEVQPSVDGTAGNPVQFIADRYGIVTGWTVGDVVLQAGAAEKCLDLDDDDYLEFQGFTLSGDPGNDSVDIDYGQGVVLRQCEIYGGDRGIEVDSGASVSIINCLIHDNARGLEVINGNASILNCTVVNNTSDGIEVDAGVTTVTNCLIHGNGDAGIDHNGGTFSHTYNLVYANSGGNFEGTSVSTGELSVDPGFTGAGSYRLGSGSPAIDVGTSLAGSVDDDFDGQSRPRNGNWDIGCYEAGSFYYVRTDGSDGNSGTGPDSGDAWATINHAATSSLQPGDIVYVQAGTYTEYVSPSVDGEIGVPIRFIGDYQGDVSDWSAGDVSIVAPSGQRSLYVDDNYLEFTGFHIVGNTIQPLYIYNASGIRVNDCDVSCASQHGIYCYNSTATFVNLLIHDCNNYGVYVFGSAELHMWNCTIVGNGSTGVVNANTSTIFVTNSIFANNGLYGLRELGGPINQSYNLYHGNTNGNYTGTTVGAGVIDGDPRFVGGGYELDLDSTAINAGLDASGIVNQDLTGRARPVGPAWDMGCYEATGSRWILDETSGTTAADSGPNANDGTYTNGVMLNVPGPYPKEGAIAAEFDGSDDVVVVPDDDVYSAHIDTGLTVSAWVKVLAFNTDGHGQTRQPIISKGNAGQYEWALYVYDYGGAGFSVWSLSGSTHNEINGGNVPIGSWAHVAATYEPGVANRVYINGELVAQETSFLTTPGNGTSPVRIGSRGDGQYLNAQINQVQFVNRVLSAQEIAELYGLTGQWKFDEGFGSVAADSSPFANDANLAGATWTNSCEGGNAIAFDGVGGIAATSTDFSPPDIGTVSFWLRGSGTPDARGRVMGINGDWEIRQETTGKLSFDLGASPFVGNEPFATEEVDEPDRWRHIIAMYDTADNTYEVYVNGELQTSGVSPVDLVSQAPGVLSFGTRTGSAEYWEGGLRDFRIYNRWLSLEQVSQLYGSLGHWKLDESSGTLAVDSSGAGNDGTYVNAPTLGASSRNTAELGTAVTFDGTNRVEIPGLLGQPENVTISAWAKLDSPDLYGAELISLGQSFAIRLDDGGNLVSFIWNGTDFTANLLHPVPFKGAGWHHFAAVFSDDNDLFELYVDGILVDSTSTTDSIVYNLETNTFIGAHTNGPSDFDFSGSIDDVRVFGRALCPDDVFNLFRDFRPNGVRIKQWVETR
ncbi:hypothetical protein HG15A2_26660 [Adhaeretor mobilis]|uniref:LamG-like jellyroll fold domain-containing protein n=2 Tax=Adhaeretor mobilis TaxID=1930276 RepID=A0A517MWU2_9BACT|nr:hypothetical protein HG15A2_26660 [Adhaeretor mobilis]